jgi:hypothetical protein
VDFKISTSCQLHITSILRLSPPASYLNNPNVAWRYLTRGLKTSSQNTVDQASQSYEEMYQVLFGVLIKIHGVIPFIAAFKFKTTEIE